MHQLAPRSRRLGSKLTRIGVESCCRGRKSDDYDNGGSMPRNCQSGNPSRAMPTASVWERSINCNQEVIITPTSTISSSSLLSSSSPQASYTLGDLSNSSEYFSILSAFEKTVEIDDDRNSSQIMLATRENIDWSYPYLLRRDQLQHLDDLSSGVLDGGEPDLRRQDTPWKSVSSHIVIHPIEEATNMRRGQRRLDGEKSQVDAISEFKKLTKPQRRAESRSKSETLGQLSLRTSYLHHNAMRRSNSTGNFSRPR